MTKTVSLTVHKNNADQRKRKEIREDMHGSVKTLQRELAVSGYAIFAWDDDGNSNVYWESGHIPGQALPAFVSETLRRRINIMDAEEVMKGGVE